MTFVLALMGAAIFVILVGFYLSWRATRLDRLHTRVETARAALDAALARRLAAVMDLAGSGMLDPASSVLLADAASAARRSEGPDSEAAETDLTLAVRAVYNELKESVGEQRDQLVDNPAYLLLLEVQSTARQVGIAHSYHTNSVEAVRAAHSRPLVRAFKLAGYAGIPSPFNIDDAPPELAKSGVSDPTPR